MSEHMLVKRVSQYVMPHVADQIVSDVEDSLWLALRDDRMRREGAALATTNSLWLALRDDRMRREGAALATTAAVEAVRNIPPTSDKRWEWVQRRAVIDAVQIAGEDAVAAHPGDPS